MVIYKGGVMKIVLLLLCLASPTFACNTLERYYCNCEETETLKYNWSTGKSEYAAPDETLRYNSFENSWSYEKPGSTMKYNWSTNSYEYAK